MINKIGVCKMSVCHRVVWNVHLRGLNNAGCLVNGFNLSRCYNIPIRLLSSLPNPKKNKNDITETKRSLPKLMHFTEVMWPSTILALKNWFSVQFIIRPYFDNEFSIQNFIYGAKRALEVVSSNLSKGDFKELQNLVSPQVMTEVKPVIQKLSVSQRKQLEVRQNEIYLSFPYQIGIIFDEGNGKVKRRWVEVVMVFHSMRGLAEMKEIMEPTPWNILTIPEYQEQVSVCNYRFIKEYTIGNHSDWTINALHHFKPMDLIKDN